MGPKPGHFFCELMLLGVPCIIIYLYVLNHLKIMKSQIPNVKYKKRRRKKTMRSAASLPNDQTPKISNGVFMESYLAYSVPNVLIHFRSALVLIDPSLVILDKFCRTKRPFPRPWAQLSYLEGLETSNFRLSGLENTAHHSPTLLIHLARVGG